MCKDNNVMKENKENAYLTCFISERCYSKCRGEELLEKALKTNDPYDWAKVPMVTPLVDCFNTDCLMRKNYKQAMENIKRQRENN
jgi:hypothetical protein